MASAIEQQFSNVFFYDSCSRVVSTLFVGPSNGARTNALLLLPFRWHLQSNNSFRMFSFMIPALALGRLCLSVRQMEQGLMLCCCCHFDGICNRTTVFECFMIPALALGRLCLSVRQMEQGLMLCCCCHFDGICNRTTVFECFLI